MPGNADCMSPQTSLGKSVSLKILSYFVCNSKCGLMISFRWLLLVRNAKFQDPPQTHCIKICILTGLYGLAPFFQRAQAPYSLTIQPPKAGNTTVKEGRPYNTSLNNIVFLRCCGNLAPVYMNGYGKIGFIIHNFA